MTNSTKLDTSKMLGFDQKGEILFGIAHPGEKGHSQTIAAGSKSLIGNELSDFRGL